MAFSLNYLDFPIRNIQSTWEMNEVLGRDRINPVDIINIETKKNFIRVWYKYEE